MKKNTLALLGLAVIFAPILTLAACSDADVASRNLSTKADNFEIARRVVLYNGITDAFIQEVKGYCSLGNLDVYPDVTITCRAPDGNYVKHMWTLSDNVTVFVEQLQNVPVGTTFYEVNFKPSVIIPDFKVR